MRKAQIALLVLALAALGFVRESFFAHINLRYYQVLYEPEETLRSEFIAFLDPLSGIQIYWFKWLVTIAFAFLFYAIGAKALSLIFKRNQWKIFGSVYLAMFVAAIIPYVAIWILGDPEKGYAVARFFLGLAQSPFPFLFMIPALYLRKSEN
jgi:hypothetical protein